MANNTFFESLKSKTLLIIPILSVIIFINQLLFVKFNNLSPWKGGGFGMFAHIDAPDMRVLKVQGVTVENDTIDIDIPFGGSGEYGPYTADMYGKLQTYPTQTKLEDLAVLLLYDQFIQDDKEQRQLDAHLNLPARESVTDEVYFRPLYNYEKISQQTPTIQLSEVTLEVFRINYRVGDQTLFYEHILEPYTLSR